MEWKNILKRLVSGGSAGGVTLKDERGFPVRRATPDELELEQYAWEKQKRKTRERLGEERRRRFSEAWKYGGDKIKIKKFEKKVRKPRQSKQIKFI